VFYLVAFAVSLIVSLFLISILIKVANKYKVYDEPGDRKIHPKSISYLGGFGIYFAVVLGLFAARLLDSEIHFDPSFFFILFGMTIIFLNGLGDDLFGYSANQKFFVQFAICFTFLDSKGVIQLYLQELIDSYILSRIILSFALVTIINSINLLDGIDGLAASMGIFITIVFAVLNLLQGNDSLAILALSLLGALVGFLYYNFNPAKIFMGDSGALLIGFVIALLTISTPYKGFDISINHSKIQVINIILAAISFPVLDVIRLFFQRLIAGASPFSGDRNHLHHILVDSGVSVKKAVLVVLSIAILQLAIVISLSFVSWLVIFIVLMFSYFFVFKYFNSNYFKRHQVFFD
jgi:UDP-N-acetylmuramyl pentapeptide phosphotransferase/UDP-N-acetylglucosamine-1-phosphate transferase